MPTVYFVSTDEGIDMERSPFIMTLDRSCIPELWLAYWKDGLDEDPDYRVDEQDRTGSLAWAEAGRDALAAILRQFADDQLPLDYESGCDSCEIALHGLWKTGEGKNERLRPDHILLWIVHTHEQSYLGGEAE